MFFLLVTCTLIFGVTGAYLFSAGNELWGTLFIVVSAVNFVFTLAYYASKNRKYSRKLDCIDCAVTDCDSDCKSDCGGPNCD